MTPGRVEWRRGPPEGKCPAEATTPGKVACIIQERVKDHERWGVATQHGVVIGSRGHDLQDRLATLIP